MIQYPKTFNLHRRDGRGRIPSDPELREPVMPEVAIVSAWTATEKIDGTSVRMDFRLDPEGFLKTEFNGRTDNAQLHKGVHDALSVAVETGALAIEGALRAYDITSITVFAEAIGPKVQGNLYKLDKHKLVAFDVLVDDRTWLPQTAVDEYAGFLGIERAPRRFVIGGPDTPENWAHLCGQGFASNLNPETTAEGVILLPATELRTQRGERVKIKVKHRDYREVDS